MRGGYGYIYLSVKMLLHTGIEIYLGGYGAGLSLRHPGLNLSIRIFECGVEIKILTKRLH